MGFIKKLLKKHQKTKPKPYTKMTQNEKLSHIQQLEEEHNSKLRTNGEKYYFSEEAKNTGQKIYSLKKEYVKETPNDFITTGANLFNQSWNHQETPRTDLKIFELVGEGLSYEKNEEYEKAIGFYEKANKITLTEFKEEIEELIESNGPGDYLFTRKINQRIRVCKKKLLRIEINKLESEAKSLEKDDPVKAISVYDELNRINPGLKKYDKRIDICKKKIN